jgi:hypothetical protein
MITQHQFVAKRDKNIYLAYLKGLEYRQDRQAIKFGVSESRYKAIIAEQKKVAGFKKVKK